MPVSHTSRLRLGDVRIEYTLGAVGTLSCLLVDKNVSASAYRSILEELIVVKRNGIAQFTGRIVAIDEEALEHNVGTALRIRALDYSRVFDKRKFTGGWGNYSYTLVDGDTVEIIEKRITNYIQADGAETKIGTIYPHELVTGDYVQFAGNVDASPNINDQVFQVISTPTASEFRITFTTTSNGQYSEVFKMTRMSTIVDDLAVIFTEYGMTALYTPFSPWVMPKKFTRAWLRQVLDTIFKEVGWVYRVTPAKVFQAFDPGTVLANFSLNVANSKIIGDVSQVRTHENYANQLTVTFGASTGAPVRLVDTYIADGTTQSWTTLSPYIPINSTLAYGYVTVNGVVKPLGLYGVDIIEWTFDPEASILYHAGAALALGVQIDFPYSGDGQRSIVVSDTAAIAALAGEVYDDVYHAGDAATQEQAATKGALELVNRAVESRTATIVTNECLSLPGSVIPLTYPDRLMSGNWMVVSVSESDSEGREPGHAGAMAFYTYQLLEAGLPTTWVDFWRGR